MSMEEQVGRLATAIEGLTAAITAAGKPAGQAQPVPAEKPAATKPRAASKPAAAAAEPEPATGDGLDDGLGGGEEVALTLEDVRAKLFAVRDNVARDKAAKILGQLGAKSIDTIPEAKFAEAVSLCDKALAEKK